MTTPRLAMSTFALFTAAYAITAGCSREPAAPLSVALDQAAPPAAVQTPSLATSTPQPAGTANAAAAAGLPTVGVGAAASAGWLRVVDDQIPYLTSPKNRRDKVLALLPAGALVEARTLDANDEHAQVKELALDLEWSEDHRLNRKGPVRPMQLAGHVLGWTFSEALRPAPTDMPDRKALCRVLAGATPPAFSEFLCENEVQFLLLGDADRPRRLAAWADLSATASLLVTLDLDALADGRSAIVEHIPSVSLSMLRQVAAPAGHTLLLAEQYMRKGNETGSEHVLFLIAADGRLKQKLTFPRETSDPTASIVHQRTGRLTVSTGANGPVIRVERSEFSQHPVTGNETSRKSMNDEAVWQQATARFAVSQLSKEPSQ